MASPPTVGGSSGTWGSELNAFLGVEHNAGGYHTAFENPITITSTTSPQFIVKYNAADYVELATNYLRWHGYADIYYDQYEVGGNVVFRVSGVGALDTTILSLIAEGQVSLPKGQLKFPATQNASSDANTLDDYEEGTWTPVISGSGGQSGQTYSKQDGLYIKIGKLVVFNFYVAASTKGTITGDLQISGLPFTCAVDGNTAISIGVNGYFDLSAGHVLLGYIAESQTVINLAESEFQGDTSVLLTTSEVADGVYLVGSGSYVANA